MSKDKDQDQEKDPSQIFTEEATQELGTLQIEDLQSEDEAADGEITQSKSIPHIDLYDPLDELKPTEVESTPHLETETDLTGQTQHIDDQASAFFEMPEDTQAQPPEAPETPSATHYAPRHSEEEPLEKTFSGAKLRDNLKIGEILLRYTKLDPDHLQEALLIQESEGGLLGDILVRSKMISSIDLMKALCLQLGIEFREELEPDEIDPALIQGIRIDYAKSKNVVPLQLAESAKGPYLLVASSNPFSRDAVEDLQVLSGYPIRVIGSPKARVLDAINRVYEKSSASRLGEQIETGFEDSFDIEGPIDILEGTENDPPVIRFVNSLLFSAVKERVSDIHIEPYEREFVVRFRKDGVLFDKARHPKQAAAAITSRIKVMGQLDIAEKRMPQDGRIKIKLAGKDVDIRLSTVPTSFGERVVMRILEQGNTVLELEDLGFPKVTQDKIDNLIHRKFGIVLVTGPTGSGKSTTLSACLVRLNSNESNIMTVEDPIEYQINGISQVQVNTKIDLTFARALRSFLRQDPDIIMVGEIRDKETAEIAINASLTGHLVLSTIHTNDSAGAMTRLIDMGVEPFLVASSLIGVIAQRLVRKVCKVCRKPHQPSDFELMQLGIQGLPPKSEIYRAVGCPSCSQSGYSGRTVISELMIVDEEVRKLTVEQADSTVIKKAARRAGMETLRENGLAKVFQGITTIEELNRATHEEF